MQIQNIITLLHQFQSLDRLGPQIPDRRFYLFMIVSISLSLSHTSTKYADFCLAFTDLHTILFLVVIIIVLK